MSYTPPNNDRCASPDLLPVEQAKQKITSALVPLTQTEYIDLEAATDRVLAEDVRAPFSIPLTANSAMDGYALRHQDLAHGTSLKVIGRSFAGSPFEGKIQSGQCVRIMTGAVMPFGTDTVVMQEQVSVNGDAITVSHHPGKGEAVRHAGEDIAKGNLVLTAGTLLSPTKIGVLASLGLAKVMVFKKVTVAILSTGDEIQPQGQAPQPGRIFDSNKPTLKAMISRLPVKILDLGVVPDNQPQLKKVLDNALSMADVVVTSGGVSVGEADYTQAVLNELGDVHFWKIAMKPGKPLAFGKLADCYFFGLPGNPVSAVVTCHQIVTPAILTLAGVTSYETRQYLAVADADIKKHPGRTHFQRGQFWQDHAGCIRVRALPNQSSGVLSSMITANCYIVLEQTQGSVGAGEQVVIQPFDNFL